MKIYFLGILQIFKITFTILLFILLPLAVFTLVASKTDKVFGIQSFVVLSGSMEPAVPLGSIIYTKPSSDYSPGDIIAFKKGELTITHRIAEIKGQGQNLGFITKGDANKTVDSELVSSGQVLGKNVVRAYHIGRLTGFLKTIPGFIILIIVPSLVLIGSELWNIKKEFEKEVRKRLLNQLSQGVNVGHSGSGIR